VLSEVRSGARADAGAWFHSAAGDLYVWFDAAGRPDSFQISSIESGPERREWWLEWKRSGWRAGRVDSKETDSREHDLRSPVIEVSATSALKARDEVLRFFGREGGGVPEPVRRFVRDCLAAAAPEPRT
jgi:hypothetical protein